jgi:Icc-related predicted phosphoesterase
VKILCISDTHQHHDSITLVPCDVLIIAGDICTSGEIVQVEKFANWLQRQSHNFDKAIIIAGNHDWAFMRFRILALEALRRAIGDKLIYLEDSSCIIDGVKFYGSPWQPEFNSWAFNVPRGEKIRTIWDAIDLDTDVLITHCPPFGIGDKVFGNSVGCFELAKKLRELNRLSLHVYGHVHAGNGAYISEEHPGVQFCNASLLDEDYKPVNPSYMYTFLNTANYRVSTATSIKLF